MNPFFFFIHNLSIILFCTATTKYGKNCMLKEAMWIVLKKIQDVKLVIIWFIGLKVVANTNFPDMFL